MRGNGRGIRQRDRLPVGPRGLRTNTRKMETRYVCGLFTDLSVSLCLGRGNIGTVERSINSAGVIGRVTDVKRKDILSVQSRVYRAICSMNLALCVQVKPVKMAFR